MVRLLTSQKMNNFTDLIRIIFHRIVKIHSKSSVIDPKDKLSLTNGLKTIRCFCNVGSRTISTKRTLHENQFCSQGQDYMLDATSVKPETTCRTFEM